MQKKGYLYAELTVTDPELFYNEYMSRVSPVLERFGAVFLVGTNDVEVIEGGRQVPRVIFLEFPSLAIAREFYFSAEYQEIITFRFNSSSAHLYLLPGL
ncbi:hypothetical protein AHFPHNDE_02889 [Pseudomonas sp. MM227]|uniref:DUF1330 domain-containing protein n=1 Tax=Pseudomonas sp. MM227 TaxID=3019968 RepID=UPI002220428E|nr:DUF1330 domain-containing protein [Pseudomonas sp. MM227]CAI3789201.1 hypothetical protein AHFPHNDE_02889 [Pseudomonas sp. MM227]